MRIDLLYSFFSKNIVLYKIFPIFVLGVLIAFYSPVNLLPFISIPFCITGILCFIKKFRFPIYFFFFLIGILLQDYYELQHSRIIKSNSFIQANVISSPKRGDCFQSFICQTKSKLRIACFTKDTSKIVQRTDNILLKPVLIPIKNRPHQSFDYKMYMRTKYCTFSCNIDSIRFSNKNLLGSKILRYSHYVHNKIIEIFDNSNMSELSKSIIKAMLIGDKSNLNENTKEHYISAGSIHILAISGLHIGIIFLIVDYLFNLFSNKRKHFLLYIFIVNFIIWGFAFICYLPNSCLRACTIISLVSISKAQFRNTSIFNIIASSALIILIFNPTAILDVGFQLSFLAYTFIIYFYPKFNKALIFKNSFFEKIKSLFLISLIAQVGTIPISLYYFQKIAVYSIISNVLVGGLIPIIIVIGLIYLILDMNFIGILLDLCITVTYKIIYHISNIPGASMVYRLSLEQTILLYLLLITTFLMFYYRKKHIIWIVFTTCILYNLTLF
ncbi:ComEC/Rec2 family competence protein [Marinilabiliaceae bacterium JC040]|nr:ComEC/Rec2 family competence protein [Marinilabiliaceae bacterium JC040]